MFCSGLCRFPRVLAHILCEKYRHWSWTNNKTHLYCSFSPKMLQSVAGGPLRVQHTEASSSEWRAKAPWRFVGWSLCGGKQSIVHFPSRVRFPLGTSYGIDSGVCKWRLQPFDFVHPAYLTHPVKINTQRCMCCISVRCKEPLEGLFVLEYLFCFREQTGYW